MTFFIGFSAGMFGGLVGLGGGIIIILFLVGILKIDQVKAHGTSLVALVFTGVGGTIAYEIHGNVDFTAAVLMASTAMATARAGARYANALPEWKLKKFFGGFLLFVSLLLLLKSYFPHIQGVESDVRKIPVLLLTGVLTGFLSGMMGVGGGTIMVPAMVLFAGFEQHLAQGSSLFAMIPAGSVGAYTHWKLGNVKTNLLIGLIPGILLGTYLGGVLAHLFSDIFLRIIFASVLIWTGLIYFKSKMPDNLHVGNSE